MNAVLTNDSMVVLPLTPEQCAALLERSRAQPQPAPDDDAAVEQVVREVRARRR